MGRVVMPACTGREARAQVSSDAKLVQGGGDVAWVNGSGQPCVGRGRAQVSPTWYPVFPLGNMGTLVLRVHCIVL